VLPSIPARGQHELVKLAKAHPGKLDSGSSGVARAAGSDAGFSKGSPATRWGTFPARPWRSRALGEAGRRNRHGDLDRAGGHVTRDPRTPERRVRHGAEHARGAARLAQVELGAAASAAAEAARFVREEYERWGRVIREAAIKPVQ
jgi:hypothetical protein